MSVDLSLVPLKLLAEEIERRHTAYLLLVADNPDVPQQHLAYWNGHPNEMLWMLEQAKVWLLNKYPLMED